MLGGFPPPPLSNFENGGLHKKMEKKGPMKLAPINVFIGRREKFKTRGRTHRVPFCLNSNTKEEIFFFLFFFSPLPRQKIKKTKKISREFFAFR